ncbi:MAG TPA: PQQ-binding-like beta-propeller repeat protein [Ktedonobacteraceae bacterium]|nr:PQQ-binding-like beta-propeller repeat protein [Ktedonobacteraceae bacterium]
MKKYTHAIFILIACLIFIVPVSFALAAGAHGSHSASPSPFASTSGGQWPSYGYDVAGTRYNSKEKTLKPANVGTMALDWSYKTGGYVQSSPAVVNGVVYIGSNDGYLYAFEASTGALLWSYYSGYYGGFIGSPAVANGVVYAGSNSKEMYALNASTGALIWSYTLGTATTASPTLANGIVYIMDENGVVYAFKARNGNLLWTYTAGQGTYTQHSQVVANGVLYFGSNDYKLYALNASTGALLWTFATGSYVAVAPAVANGVVYIGSADFKLYALNATTGALLWSFTTGSYIQPAPAVANGVVYIGSNDDKLYALNASTGALLWTHTAGSYVLNSPLVANGVVYDSSYSDDTVFALNAKTGNLLWSYAVGGPYNDDSPSVANGMLFIGANDYKVYAFALPQPMKVSPGILNFTSPAGGPSPLQQTVTLSNSGTSTLTWSAGAASQLWLTVSPTSGTIAAGFGVSQTFTVDITGLAAGSYTASVVITPSIGSPFTIVVRLTLT